MENYAGVEQICVDQEMCCQNCCEKLLTSLRLCNTVRSPRGHKVDP